MFELLWLIPAFPLAGFIILAILGKHMARNLVAVTGVGTVGLSALLVLWISGNFLASPYLAYTQHLGSWMELSGFRAGFGLHLDALSLVMMVVVTVVGFLIHLYSTEYMADDEGYSRFFAYMNLFVAAMLVLVLADNLAFLYVGWEGVGVCSYLLIGFWYREPANARAAIKAFVMTRIGDTALIVGIFLLFDTFGTLDIQDLMQRAVQEWAVGSSLAVLAAALLLGGALGKSAQLPLQTWLPDAMAGPTPVSALIHAATMVTAGVYLIARTNVLFTLAPPVQFAVAVIGVATLLLAGFSALVQSDIKRVLAYSTISQIGYMFLALGVGAWSAAMFHFFTHACFKSLLFLGAGAVIITAHHEQNMFKLGGLRHQLPITFWTFLAGAASLAALPLVTSGSYSKDMILWYAWSSEKGGPWLWAGGVAGAVITALYSFRMVFLTFFGKATTKVTHRPGLCVHIPLIVLAVLSVAVGFVEIPHSIGNVHVFSGFLETALPRVEIRAETGHVELWLQVLEGIGCLMGAFMAYVFFVKRPELSEACSQNPVGMVLSRIWSSGWGFDRLYDTVFVRPFLWLSRVNRADFIDRCYGIAASVAEACHHALSLTQTGKVRQYAVGIAIGAIVAVGIVVWSWVAIVVWS
jgi:NADH-quinone oxidoreductase subunit L